MTIILGQHVQRGATKEKSRKLDELKARRKEKSEKKRVCPIPYMYPEYVPICFYKKTERTRVSKTRSFIVTDGDV